MARDHATVVISVGDRGAATTTNATGVALFHEFTKSRESASSTPLAGTPRMRGNSSARRPERRLQAERRLQKRRAPQRSDLIHLEGNFETEEDMPNDNVRTKRSEKGLLTPDNCVVALIDHQPQMLFGVSNFDRQSIINNTVAIAKAARVFALPVVLSTVESKSFSGNLWPQIKAVFPNQVPIERTSMDAWDDKNFVAAIEKSGRRKIVLAGLWTETCVALPTIQAIHDNYEVYVVEDCCGDVSQLAHDNAMKRVIQAGAKPVTALSVMLEWQRDWAETDTYDAVMDIVKTHCGAYGIGVEYAYTMIHGAPATELAAYVIPPAPVTHK
jgi:nicotinamidase-related amidase